MLKISDLSTPTCIVVEAKGAISSAEYEAFAERFEDAVKPIWGGQPGRGYQGAVQLRRHGCPEGRLALRLQGLPPRSAGRVGRRQPRHRGADVGVVPLHLRRGEVLPGG